MHCAINYSVKEREGVLENLRCCHLEDGEVGRGGSEQAEARRAANLG